MSIIMFAIYKMVPGDPALMMIEGNREGMKPEAYQKLYESAREKLGIDKPVAVQYLSWITNLLKGDMGYSTAYKMPVKNMAATPMLNTIRLNIFTMIFVFAITIPLGIAQAVRKKTLFDNTVQVVTILGYSLPGFIIAIIFIFIFSILLEWFPMTGIATPGFKGTWLQVFADRAWHMVLPVAVMVFSSLGSITRYVRAAMIDALRMDYIRTARAKGLKEKVVIYSHAFRNSLIPVVTIVTGWFIGIFGGSIIIERMFLWNGMGKIMIDSLMQRDFAPVLAFQMFYMLLSLVGNLIIDIGYMLVDPRVKLS